MQSHPDARKRDARHLEDAVASITIPWQPGHRHRKSCRCVVLSQSTTARCDAQARPSDWPTQHECWDTKLTDESGQMLQRQYEGRPSAVGAAPSNTWKPSTSCCSTKKRPRLSVTVWNVSGDLFMISTTVDCSKLSAEWECVCRKYRPPCTCISYNSQMNVRCRTARARSLSPRPESIGDPISNSGFELSTNFLRLFRQSALLKSHSVRSSVTGPPRQRPLVSEFSENLCTYPPTAFQCQLSFHDHCYCCYCCYCRPRLEAFLDAPCASLALPVVRRLHLSFRFPGPNLVFSSGGGSIGGGRCGGGNAEPLLLPPSWWLLDASGATGCPTLPSGRCLLR